MTKKVQRKKQAVLPGFNALNVKEFGGALLKGNPREQRPISIKRSMHLVLRSTLAKGEHSFLNRSRAKQIQTLIHRLGDQMGVKVYRFANSGNHLHLIVMPRSREAFKSYIKAISGLIARLTLGVERGKSKGLKFWDARPWTRIIEWGRDFRSVALYLTQNTLEALGFIPYTPRTSKTTHKTRLVSATA